MKKFTFVFSLLVMLVTTAMAQNIQLPISHDGWVVTALNEAVTSGNEGGVAFIADDNAKTFYHSNWSSNYADGNGVNKGKDGLQAFMVELPEVVGDLSKITYTGRSDNNTSGWARGVRIYVYETLPEGWPADGLSSLSYQQKETLLASTNAALGTAAFDNTAEESLWADDRTVKTAEFAELKSGKYVLFIMDKGHDNWLTCSHLQIYQSVVPATVSDLKDIKPNVCYTVSTEARGAWASSNDGNTFTSTAGAAPDATNNKHQFAFVTAGDGVYYLWSVSANKFVLSNMTLSNNSFEAVKFHDASSQGEGRVMVQFEGNNQGYINLGGSNQMIVDGWNTIDAGNAVKIAEAAEFDPTAALEIIKLNYFKNNVKYAVSNPRGAWVSDDTRLNGTNETGLAVDATSEEQQFAFLKSNKGNTYLYSVADKKFVSKEGNYTKFTDAPVQTVYLQYGTRNDGHPWVVTFANGSQIGISNTYSPDIITFWNDLTDEGNCVKIEVAGEYNSAEALEMINATEELLDVVADINTKELGTKVGYLTAGVDNEAKIAALNEFVASIATKTKAEVKEQLADAKEFIENSYIKPAIGKFYYVRNNRTLGKWVDTEYAVYADGTNLKWKERVADDKTFLWQAVPVNGGITFKNYSTGKYLTGNANQSGAWSLSDNGEAIAFATCGYGADYALMNLTLKNWNMHAGGHNGGNGTSGNIVSWNGNASSASAWEVVETEIPLDELRTLVTTAITELQSKKSMLGNDYGYYSCDNELKAELEAALEGGFDVATADAEALYAVLNKILVLESTIKFNDVESGSYVRIMAVNGWNDDARYLGKANSAAKAGRAEYVNDGETANTVFYFDGTQLLSVGSGEYLVSNSNFLGYNGIQAEGSKVAFKAATNANNSVGAFNISFNNGGRWLYVHQNNYTDAGSSAGTADGYFFNVTAVKALPVTVSAAGYASFYAPVALEIPAEGVEVFYATEVNGDYVSLVKIESGKIPANTGVIIKADANTYNFAISGEEVAAIEGNIFKGTVNKQKITKENGSYYVLGVVDGKVGMYNAVNGADATTFINAGHKAYMYLAGAASSAGYRFDFDGTTGITEVETENANDAVIYDLTGRRVQDMNRAGIYIVNGKKVLVK